MKKLLLGLVLAAGSSFAATTVCNGGSTSGSAIIGSLDPNGYLCGDKLFTTFTGTAAGTLTFLEIDPNTYKLTFTPTGGFTAAGFTLGYVVSVSGTTDVISSFQDQMFTAAVTGNSIPNGSTATVSHTGGSPNPDSLNALTSQAQSGFVTFNPGVSSTTVLFTYNPTGNAGQTAGRLTSAEFLITESAVPEPMTLSLMGLGLAGIGLFGRKRMVKR